MSIRIIASSRPNMNLAKQRASSVFPTPVGPMKRNDPIGLRGSRIPVRALRIARDTALTASSCPTRRREISSSIFRSLVVSASVSCFTGIPVCSATTAAMSSAVILCFSVFRLLSQSLRASSSSLEIWRSRSRNSVASSYCSDNTASSFWC